MNEPFSHNDAYVDRLIEENENLLRSKGRLQQEIVALKKDLERLSSKMAREDYEVIELRKENEELRSRMQLLEKQLENLTLGKSSTSKFKWYQRLFRLPSRKK